MKKLISILLLVVTLAILMTGCSTAAIKPMSTSPNLDSTVRQHSENEQPSTSELEIELVPETQTVDFEFSADLMGVTYNKAGFGDEYGTYYFEGTNFVVFRLNTHLDGSIYTVGEDIGLPSGVGVGESIIMEDATFLALSNKYMLFDTPNGKIAKALMDRLEEKEGKTSIVHDEIPFEDLPEEEQDAFAYFCSYEETDNTADIVFYTVHFTKIHGFLPVNFCLYLNFLD